MNSEAGRFARAPLDALRDCMIRYTTVVQRDAPKLSTNHGLDQATNADRAQIP
jgi:hypothetical protein